MNKIAPCNFPVDKLERLKARFADSIVEISTMDTDMPNIIVAKKSIFNFLSALKSEEGFEYNFLSDLTAYDFNPPVDKVPDYNLGTLRSEGAAPRFFVVYHLLSLQNKDRVRVKVPLADGEELASATPLWKSADWLEREAFDMYGIRFSGHPNLRRILLDDRWVGHPQRKDYPIKKYQRFEDNLEMSAVGLED